MKYIIFPALALFLFSFGCNQSASKADAYGNFETEETLVSAEANGKILELHLEEGQTIQAGTVVGRVDSTQLVLKKEQLQATIRAIAAKSPAIESQLAVFEKQLGAQRQQLIILQREKTRVENLLKSDAAVPKQLDDLTAQIDQVQKQLEVILEQKSASGANLSTQKGGLLAEILPLEKQIAQIDDQIAKCHIVHPTSGTVLTRYAEVGEIASYGKPLYKLADMSKMILRAYVAGDQLSAIQVGQELRVFIDVADGQMKEFKGKVSWISPKAEFTPKIIQTKNERVNLVYAVKIMVPNDGSLKIGMPAEVKIGL